MQVAILVIGDEVLAGRTQDTNSHYLQQRLFHLGHQVKEVRVVSDDTTSIQLAAWELAEYRKADLVITSGGLGPTHDDRTVDAIARLHGVLLQHHAPTLDRMQERAKKLHKQGKRDTPEPGKGAMKTALVPKGATTWTNPAGAAPGLLMERRLRTRSGTAHTIVLPGVPEELRAIWSAHAEPWLTEHSIIDPAHRPVIRSYETHGQESVLAEHLEAIEREHKEIRVGSYPGWGTTRVVVTLTGPTGKIKDAEKGLLGRMHQAGIALRPIPIEEGTDTD